MRQLITRIDERLHEKLKARAAAEGRSVNALVTDLITAGVLAVDARAAVRERARAAGLLVEPRPGSRPLSGKGAITLTKGAGQAAAKALQAERSRR